MTKQFKKIAAKIYKSGFYSITGIESKYIGFKNVHGVLFTFQIDPQRKGNRGIFTAGYVYNWEEIGLTYESEYTTPGIIKRSKYNPFYLQETDNPDFILRAANSITLNK